MLTEDIYITEHNAGYRLAEDLAMQKQLTEHMLAKHLADQTIYRAHAA